jgi:serine/threonine protein kinase/tetratricopeptide (TPR) repeat protein
MTGRIISRYRVEEKLGQGGMGVVYKAHDLRLDRPVALKFFGSNFCDDDAMRQRFMQEARAASALDHPNICTIYSIEDTDDGGLFIAMAYYEGENLHYRIQRGRLEMREAVQIAMAVGRALSKAHEHGIVHRDVKPANVMLTRGGEVKLLDFGLAILAGSVRTTQPGQVMGTPAYMAPEQALGEPCDARADIWALGVVLYEMLTGQLPFHGPGHAMLRSILHDAPRPAGQLRPGIPPELDAVLSTALAKDADRRFDTAAALVADLHAVLASPGLRSESGATEALEPPALAATRPTAAVARTVPSIAVLPFANLSRDPDNEYFSEGLAEELITALAQVEGLHVVSRTSTFQFKDKAADVRQIGSTLRVSTVLEGGVRKAGDRVRVTAQLVNVADGYQLWSQRFDCHLEDIFAVQDEIAQSIVSALRGKLTGDMPALAPRKRPENMEAYHLYLKGRYHWNKQSEEGLRQALQHYEASIVEDPGFAPGWAGLADYYAAVGFWSVLPPEEVWPKARKNALRAVELDPLLAHAQISLGYVGIFCDWDWSEAGRHFRRAVELSPGDANARYAHAVYLTQMSRLDEALREMLRAQDLDPLAMNVNTALALVHYYRRQYDRAIEQARKTLELDPNYFEMRVGLGLIYLQTSQVQEGVRRLETARMESGDNPLILGLLGYGYGVAGMAESAQEILGRLEGLSQERYVAPISRALVHIGLGSHDQAFAWLDQAAEAHDALLCYLDVMPIYDSLRPDARFPKLHRRIGLANRAASA